MIIITKHTPTPGKVPTSTDLVVGELAVNTNDKKLFTKHTDNNIIEIGGGSGGTSGTFPEVDLLRMALGII